MPQDEALAILGLEPGATEREITEAHRRIAQAIHPDGGGSRYLAIKVDRAKESLLRNVGDPSRHPSAKTRKRKPSRRGPRQRPPA
jgi:DnaJ-class molecular chaperone